MQGKDALGASSKEDDWKRSGRETGKAGCRGFPVLERIPGTTPAGRQRPRERRRVEVWCPRRAGNVSSRGH